MPRTISPAALPKRYKQGQHIFFWKQIHTNQVLYSFTRELNDSHLDQIPFIGKNSKPPTIRPDVWTPLLTVFFPKDKQGLLAYRMLREFRRLHETSWDKQFPEVKRMEKTKRIHWIKDQKANSIADLAKVLSMFKDAAPKLQKMALEKRAEVEHEALRRWGKVKALAKKADEGELAKIEAEIERLKKVREGKNGEKELERIDKAINLFRARYSLLKKSQRQARKFEAEEERLAKLQLTREQQRQSVLARGLPWNEREYLPIVEEGGKLPKYSVMPENLVLAKLVPFGLQKPLPAPMGVQRVIIQWAQLTDAEHALGSWPKEVLHAEMGYHARHPPLPERPTRNFPLNEEECRARDLVKLEEEQQIEEARLVQQELAKRQSENPTVLGRLAGFTRKLPQLPFLKKSAPRRATL